MDISGTGKCPLSLMTGYRCKKLREEVNDHELINAKKDTTRPSNVYYGLNWGYRSDETVISSLMFMV